MEHFIPEDELALLCLRFRQDVVLNLLVEVCLEVTIVCATDFLKSLLTKRIVLPLVRRTFVPTEVDVTKGDEFR